MRSEVFDLVLVGPIDLGLRPCPSAIGSDVRVSLSDLDGPPPRRSRFRPLVGELVAEDVGLITVTRGRSIDVHVGQSVPATAISHFVTGPALGLALHQRKRFVLHASAARVGPRTVLFAGDSGWGKSTLVAACVQAGASFVTDDVAVVDVDDAGVTTVGGPPWVKLWPDSAAALGIDPDRCQPIYPGQEKLRVSFPVVRDRLSVDTIYVVGPGDADRVEDVSKRDAFVELTRHAYAAAILGRTDAQAWHAKAVGGLVRSVPVKRMTIRERRVDLGRAAIDLIESSSG